MRVRGKRECYKVLVIYLKSFEKLLFKKTLAKHKHCIKRFTGLHLTWQLARNSYEAWLNVAREHAAQAIRPITKYDDVG